MHYVDHELVRLTLLRGKGETPVARLVADSIITAEFECGVES